MELSDIFSVVEAEFNAVNALISKRLNSNIPLIQEINRHIINSGGKRLRPLLVLLSAKVCGYDAKAHTNLAAVIEMLHTATLLHDDVVDDSKLRRGKATVNALWGNSASVLAGDFLYSRSFEMLVELDNMKVMEIVSQGTNSMAEGEFLQLMNCRNPNTTVEDYLKVITSKTAKLFEMATQCSALLTSVDIGQQHAMQHYGLNVGMAFQLVDDVLDYAGDSQQIGKNIGDDLAEGKPTLPLIYTLQRCKENEASLIQESIKKGKLDKLADIQQIIQACGALDDTLKLAQQYADNAITHLSTMPNSHYLEAMAALAHFSIHRAY